MSAARPCPPGTGRATPADHPHSDRSETHSPEKLARLVISNTPFVWRAFAIRFPFACFFWNSTALRKKPHPEQRRLPALPGKTTPPARSATRYIDGHIPPALRPSSGSSQCLDRVFLFRGSNSICNQGCKSTHRFGHDVIGRYLRHKGNLQYQTLRSDYNPLVNRSVLRVGIFRQRTSR